MEVRQTKLETKSETKPDIIIERKPFVSKKVIIWLLIIFGVLAIIVAILLALTNLKQIHLFLNPTTVKRATVRSQVIFPGSMDFGEHVTLQFQQIPSTGVLISWVGVKVGDKVSKGQLIASLDQQAVLKQQQANLDNYWNQRLNFDQTTANNNGQSPQTALNDMEKRLLQQSQVSLEQSVFTVELQDIVQKLSNLSTPIDGVVTRVDTPVAGVNIQSADEARFEVINPSTMFFNANVDETEVENLHVGDKGILVINAFPADFIQATITDIAFASHQDSNSNTVFTVKLKLDNKDDDDYRYKFGMSGNIVFNEYAENVLTIPNDYIHTDDTGTYVLVGKEKKLIYVQTGVTNGTITEIVKGVPEGEEIFY